MWDELYLYQFLQPFLPPMAKLPVLEKLHKSPAVIISDLDGDHTPEIAAAYKQNGRNGAVILKNFYELRYGYTIRVKHT